MPKSLKNRICRGNFFLIRQFIRRGDYFTKGIKGPSLIKPSQSCLPCFFHNREPLIKYKGNLFRCKEEKTQTAISVSGFII